MKTHQIRKQTSGILSFLTNITLLSRHKAGLKEEGNNKKEQKVQKLKKENGTKRFLSRIKVLAKKIKAKNDNRRKGVVTEKANYRREKGD